MAAGMGVVAAGLLSFYFGQFRAHKSDNQTCTCNLRYHQQLLMTRKFPGIWLHGQQPGRVEGSRLVDNTLSAEPVPRPDIPVRGDTGANGKDGLVATLMSLNLVRPRSPPFSSRRGMLNDAYRARDCFPIGPFPSILGTYSNRLRRRGAMTPVVTTARFVFLCPDTYDDSPKIQAGEYVDSYIIHPEHTNSRREARERQVREAA